MARIAGIDLPKNKRGVIGLTYIYGIGKSTSSEILKNAGISEDKKVNEWNDDELAAIRTFISENIKVEGELRMPTRNTSQTGITFKRPKNEKQF
jgi:small subunit ribosomal protein S13